MGKCKDITRILSDALDRRLTAKEWVAVRLHLPTCSGCRRYRAQISLLRTASRQLGGIENGDLPRSDK
jgi:predicted anti-sigma-YlaC factor YlaD